MTKLHTCRYNMDTNRVEARFADGPPLPLTAPLWRTSTATPRHSEQKRGHYLSLGCDHGRLED